MDLEEEHLNEIKQSGYQTTKFLGEGSYGKVYKVYDSAKNVHAVKAVRKTDTNKQNISAEEHILKLVDGHPFIINLVDSFARNKNVYFVLELLQKSLHDILQDVGHFSECNAAFYMKEIILGVEYLHSRNIIYKDLKSDNILVDEKGHVRLTDFGLSEEVFDGKLSLRYGGTLCYMAPEVLNKSGHGKEVDWWSLGVLFYVMVTGEFPFILLDDLLSGRYVSPKNLSAGAKDLMSKLLKVNPRERLGSTSIGAAKIRQHQFFQGTCWMKVLDRLEVPPIKPVVIHDDYGINKSSSVSNDNYIGGAMRKPSRTRYESIVSCSSFIRETTAYLAHKSILMNDVTSEDYSDDYSSGSHFAIIH